MEESNVDEFLLKVYEVLAGDVFGWGREANLLGDGCEVVHHHLLEEVQSSILLFVVFQLCLQSIHFFTLFHLLLL